MNNLQLRKYLPIIYCRGYIEEIFSSPQEQNTSDTNIEITSDGPKSSDLNNHNTKDSDVKSGVEDANHEIETVEKIEGKWHFSV